MRLATQLRAGALLAAACLGPPAARAQSSGNVAIDLQGYYLGTSGAPLVDTSGMAGQFDYWIDNFGLLRGRFEGYGSQGRFRSGEEFLELRGFPWMGRHWTVTGGDFRVTPTPLAFPFSNFYYPELTARGFRVEASHGEQRYSFFIGAVTVQDGPRIPFRLRTPQWAAGATLRQRLAPRWYLGMRLLHLSATFGQDSNELLLFPANRRFRQADSLALESEYDLARHLKLIAEAAWGAARRDVPDPAARSPHLSTVAGVAWDTPRLMAKANYVVEPASYLPVAGYYLGDRRGPFAEFRLTPVSFVDLLGSTSATSNNLERDPLAPGFQSTSSTAGAALRLPGRLGLTAQYTALRLSTRGGDAPDQDSRNSQWNLIASRPLGRQQLRFTARELKLDLSSGRQRQRSAEFEDALQFQRFSLGGAVRVQRTSDTANRTSLFGRGFGQVRAGPLTAYANFELGNDLLSRSVFTTSSVTSTFLGLSARLGRHWTAQLETFRNRLLTELNPENVFLLENSGAPLSAVVADLNQWNVMFRVTRQFQWGAGIPSESEDRFAAERVPLVGSVTGFVWEMRSGGRVPAAGVPVCLDGSRHATTDTQGRYLFEEVPEGPHVLAFPADLPADLDPGAAREARLLVQPRRVARADLEVLRLFSFTGHLSGPPDMPLDGIVVHLLPTQQYTTATADGEFAFYNLREGAYQVQVDERTLPPGARLAPEAPAPIVLGEGSEPPQVQFVLSLPSIERPVERHMLLPASPAAPTG